MFSQQKDEEARLEALQAGTSYQPQPATFPTASGFPAPPTTIAIRPLLPPKLWPHNFLIFSIVVGSVLGFFNILTLALTIPAMLTAFLGHLQSKNGNYEGAKVRSKVTIILMILALGLFSMGWFSGWITAAFFIDCFNRGCFS